MHIAILFLEGADTLTWIQSIQQAITYIEKNLLEKIAIEDIAREAHCSAFHFQRVFSILTNMTVADYIRKRRMTLAAQDLIRTDEKIITIALKYGYDSPESFTKAFRKQHQLSPSEVRKHEGTITSYLPLTIQVSLKGAKPMNYQIIDKDSFQILGSKRTYNCKTGENTKNIPLFWDEANANGTTELLYQQNDGVIDGILGVCVAHTDKIDYWIATTSNAHSGDFETLTIPASKWVKFEVHGAMPDAMQNTWKQIYSEWFPAHPYTPTGTPELEVYTEDNPSSPDCYSKIWIPIK